jgi:ribosomal protein S27E
MEQLYLKHRSIIVKCEECGRDNNIPIKYFYDGFEGPFVCKFCGSILDIDVEEE